MTRRHPEPSSAFEEFDDAPPRRRGLVGLMAGEHVAVVILGLGKGMASGGFSAHRPLSALELSSICRTMLGRKKPAGGLPFKC